MQTIKNICFILFLSLIIVACNRSDSSDTSKASKVELIQKEGQFQLLKDGEVFYIKGAGLEFGNIESLKKHGGNSFRTWRVNNGNNSGKEILDEAQRLGLMVCMGIEIGRERHGFDYEDPQAVQEQFDRVKSEVIELKDHPALLMWGIGNELNLSYQNNKVWTAVNEISKMIHQLDGNHPTTTMLAGAETEMLTEVMRYATDLDLLSFQFYGQLNKLPHYLKDANYQGAYIVSEWGTTGHWEVASTSWNRPIEDNSHQKALLLKNRYQKIIQKDTMHCLGSYVFLWGQKQERTPTWYGLVLESGEDTEMVDMMHFLWNDKWPENRSPQLNAFYLNEKNAHASIILAENQMYKSQVFAEDPDGDTLSYKWVILKEVALENQSEGGDFEPSADLLMQFDYGEKGAEFTFSAPEQGEYRLFIYVKDNKGHAATANIPFLVTSKLK